jgi:spore coat protein U-like protein
MCRPGMRHVGQIALAVLVSGPACASSTSATLSVSAVVEQSCNLDVRPLRFALGGDATGADADSSLAVSCTPDTAFVVSLDDGQHRAAGGRRMADSTGNGFLAYELYSDAARTRRWGADLTAAVSGQVVGAQAVTLPIYGRLGSGAAGAGAYTDVVTVTVSF